MERLSGEAIALDTLTVSEFEILRLLVEAKSPEAIAQLLNISPKTVSNCHYLIKRKLGVANDIELTRLAIVNNSSVKVSKIIREPLKIALRQAQCER